MIKIKLKEFHTIGEPYNDLTQHSTITGARYEEAKNKPLKIRIKSKLLVGEQESMCGCGCGPDKNMDGVLSSDELEHHFDLDGSGEVTPYEYASHIEWHTKHPDVLRDRVKKAIGDYREEKIELEEAVWQGAELEDGTPVCEACLIDLLEKSENTLFEAKYHGRTVKLGKPFLTPSGPKKRSVYVKNERGNVVKVNFGDKKMRIKKSNPKRRKSFRARHKCSQKKDRTSSGYWSCKFWE